MPFIRLKKEPGKENNANAQVIDRRCKRKNPENKKPAWPWRNWHGPFPTLLSKCVFIPNNWPTSRWWVASLPANTKWPSDYKRTVNLRRSSSSWVTSNDWHWLAIQPTSFPKMQQQFQGMTVWMSHLSGRSMACLVVVHDCAWWRTEQWCDHPWSSYQSGPIGSVYGRLKKSVRDLSTDRIQAKRICCGVRGCDECGSLCDLWPHVLATGDASGTQQSHDQTNQRTRRHVVKWLRWDSHCRCKKKWMPTLR